MDRLISMLAVLIALALALTGGASVASAQASPHGKITVPCETCHTPASWTTMRVPSGFDHASTRFPLTGQHAAVQCRSCHPSLKFTPTSQQCARCHDDIHRGELGPLCERCHTPESWLIPDMPQRHSQTRFPLQGAHRMTACVDCHPYQEKQQYVGVPSECYGCHRQDFEATLSPAHHPAGFGTDCVVCHRVDAISWSGSFNHSATRFPLTGAHLAVACIRCHPGNNFKGAPTDCYQCHQQDFASSTNPPHATSGFSTTCQRCHSTSAWVPSTFQHDLYFPISAGSKHPPGRWTLCTDCHPSAGDFRAFACINCHAHAQSTVDPKHNGVQNYQYTSQACYNCHPRGSH